MIKIIFVCTGNVFRSMIAEKCLKHYIKENNITEIKVDSAWIAPIEQEIYPSVIERLASYNIQVEHQYKKITQTLIDDSTIIISMNNNHKDFIAENFWINSPLFNMIAFWIEKWILDINEFFTVFDEKDKKEYANYMVEYIHSATPKLVKNLHKYINQ